MRQTVSSWMFSLSLAELVWAKELGVEIVGEVVGGSQDVNPR